MSKHTHLVLVAALLLFGASLAIVAEQAMLTPTLARARALVDAWWTGDGRASNDAPETAAQGGVRTTSPAPAPRSRYFVPLPPAPAEGGTLGRITDARISGEDRTAFYLAIEANRRAESGSATARFSTLRTTAGREHRASFGVGQLAIRDHLDRLAALPDAELAELAVSRARLSAARARGEAAMAFFHLVVDRRDLTSAASTAGVSSGDAARAETASARELDASMGARFVETTGLPRDALTALVETRALRRTELRDEFRRRYAADHRVAFDPAHRDSGRMARTAQALAASHAALAAVLTRLGGDAGAAASLAHYLGVGDLAENLHGFYARAASEALGRDEYAAILARVDPITTRLRELANFEHAIAAVDGVPDLHGVERARMLGRVGRCFHGAPARARAAFFFGGELRRPRATTASELEAAIQEYRAGRPWSDDRVQEAFEELLAERGLR